MIAAMKKALLILCCMALSSLAYPDDGRVRVMLDLPRSYAPYIWVDTEGRHRGVLITLIEKLLADLGHRPSWHDIRTERNDIGLTLLSKNWAARFPHLQLIEEPLFTLHMAAYAPAKHRQQFQTPADFKGKRVALSMADEAAMRASLVYQLLLDAGAIPVWRADLADAMNDVHSGRLDAMIYIRDLANLYLRGSGLKGEVVELSMPLASPNEVLIAIGKAGPLGQHAAQITHLLKGYRRTGYDQAVMREGMVQYMAYARRRQPSASE